MILDKFRFGWIQILETPDLFYSASWFVATVRKVVDEFAATLAGFNETYRKDWLGNRKTQIR